MRPEPPSPAAQELLWRLSAVDTFEQFARLENVLRREIARAEALSPPLAQVLERASLQTRMRLIASTWRMRIDWGNGPHGVQIRPARRGTADW